MFKKIRNWLDMTPAWDNEIKKKSTHAMLKFCEDHEIEHGAVDHIRACLFHLEHDENYSAKVEYQKILWGKEGFNDYYYWAKKTFEHETEEYVEEVFHAMTERWCRIME